MSGEGEIEVRMFRFSYLWSKDFQRAGETPLGFGRNGDKTRRWLLENDLKYAQWVVAENTMHPRDASDPFAKTARWMEQAFLMMENRDEAFMDRLSTLMQDSERKLFEARRRKHDEIRALKALRRSTANGQLAQLPPELLLQILKATGRHPYVVGVNPVLNLPQVCQELRRLLGPLTVAAPRMALMIASTFDLLSPIKAKITGGKPADRSAPDDHRIGEGVGPDLQYKRLWRHMQFLASRTCIDLPNTQLRVVRTFSPAEYQELAARSMEHKAAFRALKDAALTALQRMEVAKVQCNDVLRAMFDEGRRDETAPNVPVAEIALQRDKLVDALERMRALNTEHSLYLAIPRMHGGDAGEQRMLRFLSA